MTVFPPICQYFITRRCNGGCAICALRKGTCQEQTFKEAKQSMLDLEKGGVKGVKALGGEPTLVRWLPVLVSFVNNETGLRLAILSNCHFNKEMAERLVTAGLDTFFASYDIPETKDHGMREKARKAHEVLAFFRARGLKILGVNVVIAPHNVTSIAAIVEKMSSKGIWTNLSSIIHGKGNFVIRTEMAEGMLADKDRPHLEHLSQKLIELKKAGALITNSDEYILGLGTTGVDLDWHCTKPTMLQLDYDGQVMTCPDREGQKSFSPCDLLHGELDEFERQWKEDASKCSGCYWSAAFDAFFGLPAYWR